MKKNKRIKVFLVHGLGVTEKVWLDPYGETTGLVSFETLLKGSERGMPFYDVLQDQFDTVPVRIGRSSTLVEGAESLASFISSVSQEDYVILAHSRGGLIARYAIQNLGLSPKALICLSTPHRGSRVADFVLKYFPLLRIFFRDIENYLPCIEELATGSSLIKALNSDESLAKEREVLHVDIVGCSARFFRIFCIGFLDSLGWFFRNLDELRNGKGDGLVAVKRAISPLTSMDNFHIFGVNHASILIDKRVQNIVLSELLKISERDERGC